MVYALKKQYPGKNFYCVNDIAVCPNMKKITLDKVVYSLENMKDEVVLSESIIEKSQASIRRMIELS
jgi:quinolinate synthase